MQKQSRDSLKSVQAQTDDTSWTQSPLLVNTVSAEDVSEIMLLAGPILVLGAGGFIGSHIFLQLRKYREDVYAGGILLAGDWRLNWLPESVKSESLVHFDITDAPGIRKLFKELQPQTVFNFCAYGAYQSQADAYRIQQINFTGVLNLIKAIEEYPVQAFVNSGSSSEYGLNCTSPTENSELVPNSDYAVGKIAAGQLIKYYGVCKDIPTVHLRLYSIYGPWEEPTRLIPKLVEHGLNGSYPPLVDPQTSRDFVYVDDALRAFVKTALQICPRHKGLSINIGTGHPTTLADAAKTARSVFNINSEPQFGSMPARRWDLSNWYANVSKLKELSSWQPTVDFAAGLKLTADWEVSFNAAHLVKKDSPKPEILKKVSAVIACYKDNQAIPFMHQRLVEVFNRCRVDFEIIFVNDCSPANDRDVIHEIVDRDPHVIGISHSRNFGSQAAFLSGMDIASGDAVVLLDGDMQDPPETIEKFIEKWNEGYDVIYGVREKRVAPLHMRFLYRLFYRLFRGLADINIPLDAGDFSLIDRKVFTRLLELKEKDIFLRGLRAWVGFKQIGVPYHRPERMFGVTTNNLSKNIWWAKKGIFSFSVKPLDYIQLLGIATFVVSLCLALFYIIMYFVDRAPAGLTTQFILTLGIGGIQILSLSIIGEYIKKIIEEVKDRPRYIRSEIYGHSPKSIGQLAPAPARRVSREG